MLRVLNRVFLIITGFLAVFIASAFALSVASVPAKAAICNGKTTIYMQYSLVHADFAIPAAALSPLITDQISLSPHPQFGDPEYMVFGLGDRDIYINTPEWADLKARFAAKALFLPSDRAVHIEPAYRVYENWIPIELCDFQLAAMETYILSSFSRNEQGQIMEMPGLTYTGYDKFYEADGTYTMFNSCNNWANGALKAAGVKAPIWSPFAQGVIYHAKRQVPRADRKP